MLGAIGSRQTGGGVAEVGGGPVVGLLGILQAGPVQALGHSGCLAGTVVHHLLLLLLTLLLVGLPDITVMCTAKHTQGQRVTLLISEES